MIGPPVVCFSPTNVVGRPRLAQLVAQAHGRVPIFFVAIPQGLSTAAQAYANSQRIAVFTIDTIGNVQPSTDGAFTTLAAIALQRM